ncbi:MAG: hypothetical protein GXO94_03895 [Nitrospirae bacterium]|nr:hypothetical protein [Nitrospirota bacterium]
MRQGKNIRFFILLAVFAVGVSLGLFFWNKITLPYSNPWGVTGVLTVAKYNPTNDSVRFAVFLLMPLLVLLLMYLLNIGGFREVCFGKEPESASRDTMDVSPLPSANRRIFAVLLLVFAIISSVNIPNYRSTGKFDAMHEGETLGPALSYMAGKVPYRDFLFLHGVFENPVRSVVAFKLFGKSIGSVRALESILKVFLFIMLAIFLMQIFRGNFLYYLAVFLALTLFYKHLFGLPRRLMFFKTMDVTTFSFLVTVPVLYRFSSLKRVDPWKLMMAVFFFSFIPLAAFGYAADRGIYLFATYLIVSPILYFLFFHGSRFRRHYLAASFLGLVAAVLLLNVLFRGAFYEFFDFTFLKLTKYRELQGGFIYPIEHIAYLGVCVLIAANTFWVACRFLQQLHLNDGRVGPAFRRFIEKYFIEFCLLVMSVFFYRSALGRSDWMHVGYSSPLTYILSMYILIKHYLHGFLQREGFGRLRRILVYAVTFVVVVSSVGGVYRIYKKDLITKRFPIKVKDSDFILDKYKATIKFLKENLKDDEKFFTFTNEASWYYFIDQPAPTRFPTLLYAMPYFYQEEVVEDLKKANIKYVLYTNSDWYNSVSGFNFEGFSNEVRFPIVLDYLKKNFVFYKMIDDNEIWIRKSELDGDKQAREAGPRNPSSNDAAAAARHAGTAGVR